jgi:hypothetical protein
VFAEWLPELLVNISSLYVLWLAVLLWFFTRKLVLLVSFSLEGYVSVLGRAL